MTDDMMRTIVTLDQLRECSDIIGDRAVGHEQVHEAMDRHMAYMQGAMTPNEHMRLTVDLICSLKLRDRDLYIAMMQSIAIRQLEEVIASVLEGEPDDAGIQASQGD